MDSVLLGFQTCRAGLAKVEQLPRHFGFRITLKKGFDPLFFIQKKNETVALI